MRLVLTKDNRIGALKDGGMVDVSAAFEDIRYRTAADRMPRVLAVLAERRGTIDELVAAGEPEPLPALQAPVPRPPKLIACFGNYREGWDRERQPQDMFLESPDSVTGPGSTVVLPKHEAEIFHHEAELALVIGKRAKGLPADASALDAVAGYTCAMDVSARGIGRVGPSRIGKSFDTFTPLGPAIVTTDEVPDAQNLRVTLTVNGEQRQDYTTADMEYTVPEVLAFISGYMTLVPGDVILCGTQHQGLGALQDGDACEMTIEGIGALAVSVRDPLKREWPRGIDEAMAARQRAVGQAQGG
jgi:2-keto-4-pentenoate hydratase/2-oxohepta-3-ene-1,7-dioic acid hydratase in catechol pathway